MEKDIGPYLECLAQAQGKSDKAIIAVFEKATQLRLVAYEGAEYVLVGTCTPAKTGERKTMLVSLDGDQPRAVILTMKQTEILDMQPAAKDVDESKLCLIQKWSNLVSFNNPVFPDKMVYKYRDANPPSQDQAAEVCKSAYAQGDLKFHFIPKQPIRAYCGFLMIADNAGNPVPWSISMAQGKASYDIIPPDIAAWNYCDNRQRLSACNNDHAIVARLNYLQVMGGHINPRTCPAILKQYAP